MIDLSMIINKKEQVVNISAKRIDPVNTTPQNGTLCTYELRKNRKKIGKIVCEYGMAEKLGIVMLEAYIDYNKRNEK